MKLRDPLSKDIGKRHIPASAGSLVLADGLAFARGQIPARAGDRARPRPTRRRDRQIPADAGELRNDIDSIVLTTRHPRACGGSHARKRREKSRAGASPRVRGNLGGARDRNVRPGRIPARAGNPDLLMPKPSRSRRIPARAGEPPSTMSRAGASPRERGKPDRSSWTRWEAWKHPRRRGKLVRRRPFFVKRGQSPRMEKKLRPRPSIRSHKGLSPRMRGTGLEHLRKADERGRIPARAGGPPHRSATIGRPRAHPRGGGGKRKARCGASQRAGISPRMRGHPSTWALRRPQGGHIPAYAGGLSRGEPPGVPSRAYPRVCGGTRRGRNCFSGL